MFRLFVSHLAAECEFAALLQAALLPYGISAFVVHSDIEPTLEWQSQIEAALATADSLVALLHPKFRDSKWTDQEIGFAMGRGLPVFAVAKERVGYLEDLEFWDASYVPRIKAAAKSNSQISGSWGVPDRATALAKKWGK